VTNNRTAAALDRRNARANRAAVRDFIRATDYLVTAPRFVADLGVTRSGRPLALFERADGTIVEVVVPGRDD
jgi:hypothetical protein